MTRTVLAVLAATVAAAAAAAPAFAQSTILPGYWESRGSIFFVDQKPVRKCITASQVDEYMSGPSNRHYTCTYTHKQISGGKADMVGSCVDHKGRRSEVAIHGAYSPTEFNVRWSFHPRVAGLSIPLSGTMQAHRLSATCPAGAK